MKSPSSLVVLAVATVALSACEPANETPVASATPAEQPAAAPAPARASTVDRLAQIDRTQELMVKAAAATANGDGARARRYYRQVLQFDPRHPSARHQLGLSLWKDGERDDALRELENGLRRNPGHQETRRDYAVMAQKMGQPQAALDAVEPLAFKEDIDASLLYAALLNDLGRHKDAIDAYRKIARERPSEARALEQLAVLSAKHGSADDALAAAILVSRAKPRDAAAHFNVAVLMHRRGDLASAADWYEKSAALDPANGAAEQASALRQRLAEQAAE